MKTKKSFTIYHLPFTILLTLVFVGLTSFSFIDKENKGTKPEIKKSIKYPVKKNKAASTISSPWGRLGGVVTPPFSDTATVWADSVFNKLSSDERIAQLFMVAAYSNICQQQPCKDKEHSKDHITEILKLVMDYKIGGLIFFQGGPLRQATLTNLYQSKSKVPLMISIDGEWGLAMRLDSTTQFPRQMTLGAIQNDSLIYEMGAEIARQCKRIGIQVNLAPVVDVNNNPENPVISNRSFGEDKYNVARKGIAYMKGMQDKGVLANAKHFPGHGDTDSDSHKTLPIIKHNKTRIDTLELYPFKELIKNNLGSMMVAHLYIPSLDSTVNTASTLSKNVVTDLLKNDLNFKGLVFTDALNMKGVSKYYAPGVVDVKALLAGNDVLLFAEDVPTAIVAIKAAINKGEISQEEIDKRCKKILVAKQWLGLNKFKPVELKNLYQDLNTVSAELINRKLTEASLTLLSNKNNLIPLMRLDTLKIASLTIGNYTPSGQNIFQNTLSLYSSVEHFGLAQDATKEAADAAMKQLSKYNLIIININGTTNNPHKNFGLKPIVMETINQLKRKSKVVVSVFANPYALGKLKGIEAVDGLLLSYEENEFSQSLAAQLIFGGVAATGKLPISIYNKEQLIFKVGSGINTSKNRLKYTIPEELNINSLALSMIDSIANYGIQQHAYPGCQILVAKSDNVIYQKSFGNHIYMSGQPVKNDAIYDIASITKIAATLLSIMKLKDEEKFDLDNKLCDYLYELDTTNKQNIVLRDMLAHQSGLRDWIPFYTTTLHKKEYKPGFYNPVQTPDFPHRVASGLYVRKNYPDSIMLKINESKMSNKKEYKYSDLGYFFLKRIVEKERKEPLDLYVQKNFYAPLGMTTTGYKPRERFPLEQIVPTEFDVAFRKQLIHGDVHDPAAAMLGGVAGHAGVFSNANDLAKLMQMYLNMGEYGGTRYLKKETLEEFTSCQFCQTGNRRGAGFDKPDADPLKDSPACNSASLKSFGHTGFTGTMAWADPEKEIVYVFLSNRVYPDAENKKITKMGIRSRIQQVIYDAINVPTSVTKADGGVKK